MLSYETNFIVTVNPVGLRNQLISAVRLSPFLFPFDLSCCPNIGESRRGFSRNLCIN